MCSCGVALCSGCRTPRRGWAAGTRRTTARAGARGVEEVGKLGEGGKWWKIIKEVERRILEPSTKWARHPPNPFIPVDFWEHVGEYHSQPSPEDYYGHPGNVPSEDHVDEHANREGNIRVEGGGKLSDEMVEDDSLPKTDEDAMNAKAVIFGGCINKKA